MLMLKEYMYIGKIRVIVMDGDLLDILFFMFLYCKDKVKFFF